MLETYNKTTVIKYKGETPAIIELLKIANNVITEFENSDYVSEQDYKDWVTTRNLLKEIIRQRLWG